MAATVAARLLIADKADGADEADGAAAQQRAAEARVVDGAVPAQLFRELGAAVYDAGYSQTAVCRSRVCAIDGERGVLLYRGYAIEELAARSTFLEVAFLLIHGELPDVRQLDQWTQRVLRHTYVHENLVTYMKGFRYDAHPMGMVVSTLAAMSTLHPEANPALQGRYDLFQSDRLRNKQVFRLLGKVPTIAAFAYRHRIGRPYNMPSNQLGYVENFLFMLDRLSEPDYRPDARLCKALDILFILHAEHELNCSTAAARHWAATDVDPYTVMSGAAAALYGPAHGGANEAALRMLQEIGTKDRIPQFIAEVKAKKRRLMGFGHRVYKSYDPRARILKGVKDMVYEVMGKDDLYDVAEQLERIALSDEYFIKRNLFPNIDFYSGLIYKAIGFPMDFFPVLFLIPRLAGWLAHWVEQLSDPDNRVFRPPQVSDGSGAPRAYVPMDQRATGPSRPLSAAESGMFKRRGLAQTTL